MLENTGFVLPCVTSKNRRVLPPLDVALLGVKAGMSPLPGNTV